MSDHPMPYGHETHTLEITDFNALREQLAAADAIVRTVADAGDSFGWQVTAHSMARAYVERWPE